MEGLAERFWVAAAVLKTEGLARVVGVRIPRLPPFLFALPAFGLLGREELNRDNYGLQ